MDEGQLEAWKEGNRATNLIDEQDPRNDLGLPLLTPLRNLGVNLLPHLRPYLPGVPSKQGQETLHEALQPKVLIDPSAPVCAGQSHQEMFGTEGQHQTCGQYHQRATKAGM